MVSRWCGESNFQTAYSGLEALFSDYNVVAYFSEYGCNNPSPRVWTEVGSLFSSQMSPVWSGGLAFSYFPAESAQVIILTPSSIIIHGVTHTEIQKN